MVVKPEQDRVRTLLTDTVTLLCKNGLTFSKEMKVQGTLGITLDENDVLLIHINEVFAEVAKEIPTIDFPASLMLDNNSESTSSKKRRKRRGSRDSESGSATPSKRNRDTNSHESHEVRVKEEKQEDVICLEDNDEADIKPHPLREASFSSFAQMDQNNQQYSSGMLQQSQNSVPSQMSDNSNASWDGSSSSQLPHMTPYKGVPGMQGGTPGSGEPWNAADPNMLRGGQPIGASASSAPLFPMSDASAFLDNTLDPLAASYSSHLTRSQVYGKEYRPRDSNNKPFMCEVRGCGKSFYHRHNMIRHQRTAHQGEASGGGGSEREMVGGGGGGGGMMPPGGGYGMHQGSHSSMIPGMPSSRNFDPMTEIAKAAIFHQQQQQQQQQQHQQQQQQQMAAEAAVRANGKATGHNMDRRAEEAQARDFQIKQELDDEQEASNGGADDDEDEEDEERFKLPQPTIEYDRGPTPDEKVTSENMGGLEQAGIDFNQEGTSGNNEDSNTN